MIALRSGNSTRALLESAARRLVLRDPPTTLRRTDQEYLTVELLRSEEDQHCSRGDLSQRHLLPHSHACILPRELQAC